MRRHIRREALERLAILSAQSPDISARDISKLKERCPGPRPELSSASSASGRPTSIKLPEFEALIALCKAALRPTQPDTATHFIAQIAAYLPVCHSHSLEVAHSWSDFAPSPWESLAYHLSSAVFFLGLKHEFLHRNAYLNTAKYLDLWMQQSLIPLKANLKLRERNEHDNNIHPSEAQRFLFHDEEDEEDEDEDEDEHSTQSIGQLFTLSTSILGFLGAAASYAQIWTARERLAILRMLRQALSEAFFVSLETSLSIIRNSRQTDGDFAKWRHCLKKYASDGRPLGAMLLRLAFVRLATTFASLQLYAALGVNDDKGLEKDILDFLLAGDVSSSAGAYLNDHDLQETVELLADISTNELRQLEAGSDYLQLGSTWLRNLGSSAKAFSYTALLCCAILDDDVVDPDNLRARLEITVSDHAQVHDHHLASVVFKSISILANFSPELGSKTSAALTTIIANGGLDSRTSSVVADCIASLLKRLPQDSIITTLYTLENALPTAHHHSHHSHHPLERNSSTNTSLNNIAKKNINPLIPPNNASLVSLHPTTQSPDESSVYLIVIESIVKISIAFGETKVIALAINILNQKRGKISLDVDAKIITESAVLGVYSDKSEFKTLLKRFSRDSHDALIQINSGLPDVVISAKVHLDAVMAARVYLSQHVEQSSELFEIYLLHLLEDVVTKVDAPDMSSHHHETKAKLISDGELATQGIAQLLRPLAALAAANMQLLGTNAGIKGLGNLQRDSWFNAVAHGFTLNSEIGRKHFYELKTLAQFSLPLIAEDRTDHLESDIELNTTLRRGKSDEQASVLRKYLLEHIPRAESSIKSLRYSELVFITATHMVEILRAQSGDCTKVLTYFLDPKLCIGDLGTCMEEIAQAAVTQYLYHTKSPTGHQFASRHVAQQLALFFAGCCHRISKVQSVAIACVQVVVDQVPSSLCHKASLYALFELLSIMWISCLEKETEEYQWRSKFVSKRGNVEIQLPDDYDFRSDTLIQLHSKAKKWIRQVLDIALLDIKGLIQTYLSEYADDSSYDHVSLGRSFALEMGGMIPTTDYRLKALPHPADAPVNTASDFIVQYTIRQEYRHNDSFQDSTISPSNSNLNSNSEAPSIESTLLEARDILAHIRQNTQAGASMDGIRDVLRRAGALLCRSKRDEGDIIYHLVRIPFALLTKQAIKLGISLWTGVIKENSRTEARILAEIVECWEDTILSRRGLFDSRLGQMDPFMIKQEFAPSDAELIKRRQHFASELIGPHTRLLQFFSSHFHATRFGSRHIQRSYQRLMSVTMRALGQGMHHHPLARETLVSVVLLTAKILQFSTNLSTPSMWRLKDRLLSAALSWFSDGPKWSYGGNKLQLRAECALLGDLRTSLERIRPMGRASEGSRMSLNAKQDLLAILLSNEQARLNVWLCTTGVTLGVPEIAEAELILGLKTAWAEDPDVAIQLCLRFQSQSQSLASSLRTMIMNSPDRVLHNIAAIEIILGDTLASDAGLHLKYLLYWQSVNPITAVSYFLPAYKSNPFIIQYAVRALESHAVDTTFFYVPQIVQTLRYDTLGYVERYIIETAKISQLFAHQIIWNMKANDSKDEGCRIDGLGKVMERLVQSFSPEGKEFYHREFDFFDEITGISGKLKPYIKKSKAEKKQKIEEELRKIRVKQGVYLPSNPDGVLIGIDRTSGKPLQSHAKAPYMATFRIRRERFAPPNAEEEEKLCKSNSEKMEGIYETWQSAIFKVGDDCRQDVLALQMIAAFRGIYHSVGLDVYVNPYRVTATAPGCGVIDVLPNSISRDMLGREAVNGLLAYFSSKYGGEKSIAFQKAKNNFVKSMAAYSVISYLLQMKDRHNGNIMIDDAGHILHIDFGFCFDIAPGGIKFERAPFKLTQEMVAVMGGQQSQAYVWFEELCVKAFLACRQHSEHLTQMVRCMIDSGLPCFKPHTIKNFRERFVPDLTDGKSADFMRDLIRKSNKSIPTKVYDQFQLLTNGIPH